MQPVEVSDHIFKYQSSQFPRVSSRGNRSVMMLYDYGSNNILTDPLKNNTYPELVKAQTRLTQYLLDHGLNPMYLCIEKECPKALKRFFRANIIDFQLCLTNDHHVNQSEKAIDTRKCHFL